MAFNGWGRICLLTLDRTKVQADTSDFPWLFTLSNLPSEMFDADGTYPASNGGGDIRFSTDPNGNNRLSIEVVTFVTNNNPALGSAEIWVKIPFVSSKINTEIYVWYNNSGQTQPSRSAAFGSESVWSDDFRAVFHMNQDMTGTAPQLNDSTSNLNHGTARNSTWLSWASGDTVAAKFGSGLHFQFNGWDNCPDVTVADATSMRPDGHAVEVISKQDTTGDDSWSQLFGKGNADIPRYSYGIQLRDQGTNPGDHAAFMQKSSTLYGSTWVTSTRNNWYHWMSTYEHSGPNYNINLHKDGAAGTPAATASGAIEYAADKASLGNRGDSPSLWTNYEGIMEEVRVHGKYRSPEYANLSYVTTFDFTATTVGTPAVPSARIIVGNITTGWASGTSVTISHTICSGVNRFLCVFVNVEGSTGGTSPVTGVTYNGVALTRDIERSGTNGTTYQHGELWHLAEANLPTTGSFNVVVSLSSSLTAQVASICFSKVRQDSPEMAVSNYVSGNTYISQSITTITAYDIIVTGVGSGAGGSTYTQDANQTERWDFSDSGGTGIDCCGSTKEMVAGASTTVGATCSVSANRLVLVAVALSPFEGSIVPRVVHYNRFRR